MEKRYFEVSALIELILFFMVSSVFAFPNFINYQGQLTDSSDYLLNGEYALTFMIYSIETEGEPLWTEQHTVTVTNGLYNVELGALNPFPEDLFETEMLYLEVMIHNTDTGYGETLSPRIPFTSTGFSMKAKDAETVEGVQVIDLEESQEIDSKIETHKNDKDAHHTKTTSFSELSDIATDAQIPDDITISYAAKAGDANTVDGKHASEFGDGHSLDAADGDPVDVVYVDSNGNVGIDTSTPNAALQIIGAISRQGTTLSGTYADTHVNLGINSFTDGNYPTVSGGELNTASGNYSTVSGGNENTANGWHSTVSGGSSNTVSGSGSTVSGGIRNTVGGWGSTVSGGLDNNASDWFSTVSGGYFNTVSAWYSTVSGGYNNTASGYSSTVSGGYNNTASGNGSTVSGGRNNIVAGTYSWAGGHNMQLTEDADRTFAWGYSDSNVSISTPDAFIIYSGNVGIGTTNPAYKLHVDGDIYATGTVYGASGTADTDWTESGGNVYRESGNVGIGTSIPNAKLNLTHSWRGELKLLTTEGGGHDIGYNGGIDNYFAFCHIGPETGHTNFSWGSPEGFRDDLLVIKNSGNVGIGTTSPVSKLEVAGNIEANGFTINGVSVGTSTDTYWSESGGDIYYNSGNLGIGTTGPVEKFHLYDGDILADRGWRHYGVTRYITLGGARRVSNNQFAALRFQNYDDFAGGADFVGAEISGFNDGEDDAGLQFSVATDLSLSTAMTIKSTGNVGIGKASPSQRLDVDGNAVISGNLGIGTTGPIEELHLYDGDILADRGRNTAALTRYITLGGARNLLNNIFAALRFQNYDSYAGAVDFVGAEIAGFEDGEDDAGLQFSVATDLSLSTAMTIKSTGNVGIGTTKPQQKLHVSGVMRLEPQSIPPSGELGDLYAGTDGNIYFHNGTEWKEIQLAL